MSNAVLLENRQFLRSEFAMVEVAVLHVGTSDLLRVRNAETDEMIELDVLELESLTRRRHGDLSKWTVR